MATLESLHLSVRVERSAKDVYDYASKPENIQHWAKGLASGLKRDGDEWVGDGPGGRLRVRFTERNAFGILDHHVTVPDGKVVYIPVRVLASGSGSEVVFTLFRAPGVADEAFAADAAAVRRDLETLKKVVEARGSSSG